MERWLADLLQPVFDNLISDKAVPRFVQRLRILEFTLDHEAPYFDNMRRRSSRKDSDLNGVVDVRYTGGARMLLQLEVGQGRWRLKASLLNALCQAMLWCWRHAFRESACDAAASLFNCYMHGYGNLKQALTLIFTELLNVVCQGRTYASGKWLLASDQHSLLTCVEWHLGST